MKRRTIGLGAALAAFIAEHEYCGELDTGLENDRVGDVHVRCRAQSGAGAHPVRISPSDCQCG